MKDDNKACQLQLQLFPSDPERHGLASLPCLVQHVFARSLPDILLVNLGGRPRRISLVQWLRKLAHSNRSTEGQGTLDHRLGPQRDGMFKTPRPLCQRFCCREVSCLPFFLRSSILHCAHTNNSSPVVTTAIPQSPCPHLFCPLGRPSRLQSLPLRRHTVSPKPTLTHHLTRPDLTCNRAAVARVNVCTLAYRTLKNLPGHQLAVSQPYRELYPSSHPARWCLKRQMDPVSGRVQAEAAVGPKARIHHLRSHARSRAASHLWHSMPASIKRAARRCACKLPKLPLLPGKRQSRANLPNANETRIMHSTQRRPQHKIRSPPCQYLHNSRETLDAYLYYQILDNTHLRRIL